MTAPSRRTPSPVALGATAATDGAQTSPPPRGTAAAATGPARPDGCAAAVPASTRKPIRTTAAPAAMIAPAESVRTEPAPARRAKATAATELVARLLLRVATAPVVPSAPPVAAAPVALGASTVASASAARLARSPAPSTQKLAPECAVRRAGLAVAVRPRVTASTSGCSARFAFDSTSLARSSNAFNRPGDMRSAGPVRSTNPEEIRFIRPQAGAGRRKSASTCLG